MTEKSSEVLPSTEMIYYTYDGNFALECSSKVVGVTTTKGEGGSNDTVELYLDRTVMHAQGGGQPTDIGTIVFKQDDKDIKMAVDKVLVNRETGVATHHGKLANDGSGDDAYCLPVGATVHVSVDKDTRRILSECHTAGHTVDSAMARCGKLMKPTKGYHFLDGPYVEYEGSIALEERPQLLAVLQTAFQELVDEDIATDIQTLPEDQASELCNRIAKNFDMKDFGGGKDDPADIR